MSLKLYYADAARATQEITAHVDILQKIKFVSNAEQGSVGSCDVKIDDPTGTYDIHGHRPFWAEETAAPANNQRIYLGYAGNRTYVRDMPPGFAMATTRNITISLSDPNTLLTRRLMRKTEDSADRPAETDVARMTWLLATNPASSLQDVTTYVSSANPVAMDATNYDGQSFDAVVRDCADQAGKNFWVAFVPDGAGAYPLTVWYDKASSTAYSSSATISNDKADINNTTCFSASEDTKLVRDPSRVFSRVRGNYSGGFVLRTLASTAVAFADRDTTASWPNVKTVVKANARGDRYLLEIATEEDIITTTIRVTAAHVNDIREGMRVQAKFTHTDYTSFTWMRVLDRTIAQVPPANYDITLTLSPQSTAPVASCSTILTGLSATVSEFGPYLYPVVGGNPTPPAPAVLPSIIIGGFGGGADSGGDALYGFVGTDYTQLSAVGNIGGHFETLIGYHAQSAAGLPPAFAITQVGGGPGGPKGYTELFLAIQTAATAPVQVADQLGSGAGVTFGATPTVGNLIVAFTLDSLNNSSSPRDLGTVGWTLIDMSSGTGGVGFPCGGFATAAFGIWARCVQAGDTTVYGTADGAFAHWTFASEWALT